MIRCHLRHLEARCRQRGYTLEQVRACIVRQDGDQITVDETHPAYPAQPKPGVSLPQKVANFAASAAKHLAAGMPRATDEQVAQRFAICQGCEFLSGGSCSKCGCPVVRQANFISKLSWAGESCPVGKWGPVSS
jgi:hypothetical protein